MWTRLLVALAVVLPFPAVAQDAPAGSTEVFAPDLQEAFRRAVESLAPGVTVHDRIVSLADMGDYNVAVAVIARPEGTFTSSLAHEHITEIYYVLRGSGTHVTGRMVDGTLGERVSTAVGPTRSSTHPIEDAKTVTLGPGDIQIIPPGVAHGFTSIDPGGIEYLTFRVDPDRVLSMPAPAQ